MWFDIVDLEFMFIMSFKSVILLLEDYYKNTILSSSQIIIGKMPLDFY